MTTTAAPDDFAPLKQNVTVPADRTVPAQLRLRPRRHAGWRRPSSRNVPTALLADVGGATRSGLRGQCCGGRARHSALPTTSSEPFGVAKSSAV